MRKMPLGFQLVGLRAKYKFALLIFSVSEVVFLFLSLYISEAFLIAVFVTLIIIGFYVINLKCPVCDKPVLLNPIQNFGIEMYAYTPTIPTNCTKCNTPLN
jgi:hypothetical protein